MSKNLQNGCEISLTRNIVLVDIFLSAGSGLDLIKDIHYRWPKLPIVAMSMYSQDVYAGRVLSAGGVGYVEKGDSCERIVEGLRLALRGEFCFAPEIVERLKLEAMGAAQPKIGVEKLTDRELEIFELYGLGLTMEQIAERLFIGRKTVETHRERIRKKLGFRNNSEIIRLSASRKHPAKPPRDEPLTPEPATRGPEFPADVGEA